MALALDPTKEVMEVNVNQAGGGQEELERMQSSEYCVCFRCKCPSSY